MLPAIGVIFMYLAAAVSLVAGSLYLHGVQPVLLYVILVLGAIVGLVYLYQRVQKERRPRQPDIKVTTTRDLWIGVTCTLICGILWAISFVSLSVAAARVDIFEINIIVLGSSTIFLYVAFLISKFRSREDGEPGYIRPNWAGVATWVVVIGNLASFVLFIAALYYISASQTLTLQKTNPLLIAIGTWIFLKKIPSFKTFAVAMLVVLGTTLIMLDDQFQLKFQSEIIGSLLALAAGASFAAFSVGLDGIEESKSTLTTRLAFMTVVFCLSFFGIIAIAYFMGHVPSYDTESLNILLFNGLRVAIVYMFYYEAVRRIGALLTSILLAIGVPLTMVVDFLWLDREPGPGLVLGAVAILAGGLALWYDQWPRVRRQS